MPPRDLNDTKYWRDQANELRAIADTYTDKVAAASLRRLAIDYDQMANRAQERINRGIDLPSPSVIPKEKNP